MRTGRFLAVLVAGTAIGGVCAAFVGEGRVLTLRPDGMYEVRDAETNEVTLVINPGLKPDPTPLSAPSVPNQAGWPIQGVVVAVADVDGDGDLEVVGGTATPGEVAVYHHTGVMAAGWPKGTGGPVGTVSLADLTGDGKLEIIAPGSSSNRTLYVYRHDGTLLWSRTATCCFRQFTTPAIADVDGDGLLDVFSIARDDDTSDTAFLVNGQTGANKPGWPKTLSGYGRGPYYALTDVDGDGFLEIIYAGYEGWNHDGTVVAGYPKSKAVFGKRADFNADGTADWGGKLSGGTSYDVGVTDLDVNPFSGWPADTGSNPLPSVCGMGSDGKLNMAWATVNNSFCDGQPGGLTYLYNHDGTMPPGWPVCNGNFGSGMQTLVGDITGDGQLNFIAGADEGSFTPTSKIVCYREDGSPCDGFPWTFAAGTWLFGNSMGILVDLDLDGDVELGMYGVKTDDARTFFWDFPAPYNPLNMHWRMRNHNLQRTGEWHPPSYYVPQVNAVEPALTWVTSCAPVSTLKIHGANFESKPFVRFVPETDAPAFYAGNLALGIPAASVAQPQIHPVTGVPQNPLNATYLEVGTPSLPIGRYHLVIQNPTGIRNTWNGGPPPPVIEVTDDVNASVAPVGDTLMVGLAPNDALAFSWGSVGNAEYVVRYDTAPDGTFTNEAGRSFSTALTSASPAGTTLYFKVSGVNSCGFGE